VEQGGWLDQFLLSVLGLLNARWLEVLVAVGGSFVVACLARLSPKQDWAFVKAGPGRVLTGAFLLLAGVRSAPRLLVPTTTFSCERVPGLLGIPETTNCHWTTHGTLKGVDDYTFVDFWTEFLGSLLREAIWGAVGLAAGFLVATLVLRRVRGRTAD
jgi:hypothetical protein